MSAERCNELFIYIMMGGCVFMGVAYIWSNIQMNNNLLSLHEQISINENMLKDFKYQYKNDKEQHNININTMIEQNNKLIKMLDDNARKDKQLYNSPSSNFSPIAQPIITPSNPIPVSSDDDELMCECYDIIPLNNVKKQTKLVWLF